VHALLGSHLPAATASAAAAVAAELAVAAAPRARSVGRTVGQRGPRGVTMPPPPKNLTSVRMMLSGFIGLAVVYAGTAVYTFQLRGVDETPEIRAAKAKILAERDARRKVRAAAAFPSTPLLSARCAGARPLTAVHPAGCCCCCLLLSLLLCWA
jgi:hypothetical protein